MSDLQQAFEKLSKAAEEGAKKLSDAIDRAFDVLFDKIDEHQDKKEGINPKPDECFEEENEETYFAILSVKSGKFIRIRKNKRNELTVDARYAMKFKDETTAKAFMANNNMSDKNYTIKKVVTV